LLNDRDAYLEFQAMEGLMTGLHDNDFYAWTQEQASLLRAGKLNAADIEHIAEEIESMGAVNSSNWKVV
jgi:hypothetical protein